MEIMNGVYGGATVVVPLQVDKWTVVRLSDTYLHTHDLVASQFDSALQALADSWHNNPEKVVSIARFREDGTCKDIVSYLNDALFT